MSIDSQKSATLPLWQHQKDGLQRALGTNHLGLFWEPGTGKTRMTVEILRTIYNVSKAILPTLILCPKVVISNWKSEIMRFSGVPGARIVPLVGPGQARLKLAQGAPAGSIFITNYEALQMDALMAHLEFRAGLRVLICDESQRVKTYNSKRTKYVTRLADICDFRYILTGTPVLNSQMDLFSQFRILDRGETLGTNYFAFRAQYFYDKNAGMPKQKYFPDWRPRPDTTEKLTNLIAKKVLVAKKEECLDLPPLLEKVVEVELTPQQKRMYEEMKKDFITFLGTEACTGPLAITKALRLQQIVSGYVRTEDMNDIVFEDTPREAALHEILEDLTPHHKVIVWAVFHSNYTIIDRVCERLGVKRAFLTGQIQDKDKQIDLFRNDPECRVMIAHPQAGGVGVNLIEASYSIVYSRNFSLENELQSKARNYRGGSERHEKITRIHLVSPGTIDALSYEAVEKKEELSNKIMSLKSRL